MAERTARLGSIGSRKHQVDDRVKKRVNLIFVIPSPLGVKHHVSHLCGGQAPLAREQGLYPIEKRIDLRTSVSHCEKPTRSETLATLSLQPPTDLREELLYLSPPSVLTDLGHIGAALTLSEYLFQTIHRGINMPSRIAPALERESRVPDVRGLHRASFGF